MGQATSKNPIRIVPYVHEKTLLVEILQKYIAFKNLLPHDYKYIEMLNYTFTFLIKRLTFDDNLKNSLLGYQEEYEPFKSFLKDEDIPERCYCVDIEETNYTNILSEELTIEDDHIANIFYLLKSICRLYVRTEKFTKYDKDQLKICLDKINMYTNFLYPHNTLKWTELKYKVVPYFMEHPEKNDELRKVIISLSCL